MRTKLFNFLGLLSLVFLLLVVSFGTMSYSSAFGKEVYYLPDNYSLAWHDSLFSLGSTSTRELSKVYSAIAPHHLVAGREIAELFTILKEQNPEVVVIVGPDHSATEPFPIFTNYYTWGTPYGNLKPDINSLRKLLKNDSVYLSEKTDMSVTALLPFVKKTWPEATVIPVYIKQNVSSSTINNLARELHDILPGNSLVIGSVDFSHYLPAYVADYHDALSKNVLATSDLNRVKNMEIDSQNTVRLVLKYNEFKKSQAFKSVAHTNSAYLAEKPDIKETTSHILGYFVAGNPDQRREISIQFFGDMMLERNVGKAMGKDGLNYLFKNLAGQEKRFFTGQDLIIANLEGPFAPSRIQTSKEIAFRFDPLLAKQLKNYGFDVFSLANNHTYDMGSKNVAYTKKILQESGLRYFGDQFLVNTSSLWVMTDKDGLAEKVALLGFNTTNQPLSKDRAKNVLQKAREESRYVIVFMHWGNEYEQESHSSQREMARWLIDNGATAIIGGHPHVVQEIEVYNGHPIFYSLGNFIFDQYFSKETQEGYSVGLILREGRVSRAYLFPFYGKKSQVNLMIGKQRDEFFNWMNKNSRLKGLKIENGVIVF